MPLNAMKTLALCTAASLTVAGCMAPFDPDNPRAVSASDRQSGAEAHPQILAEFGGAYTGPGTDMVRRVGRQVAIESGISSDGSNCTVTLLNSSVVNAFAIPGCYTYVTRGLLALMDNEAQLASVLGHEVGHVAANHSQRRQNAALGSGLLGVLAGVLTGSGQIAQLAGQIGQVWTLSYSRDQEYQADDLGIRYMTSAGYNPYESADVLDALGQQAALEARIRGQDEASQIPAWARTHPLSADRVTRATAKARETGMQPGQGREEAAAFLSAIDGIIYGDAPEQGYVDGHRFAHPTLRLAFTVPDGFYLNNGAAAVTATSGDTPVQIQFAGGSAGSPSALAQQALGGILGQAAQNAQVTQVETGSVNGMATATQQARVATQSGQTDVTVVAIQYDASKSYYFAFVSPANVDDSRIIQSTVGSFEKLSSAQASALDPRVIDVVTVKSGDTVSSLARRMAFDDYREERFRVLNGLSANAGLQAGEQVKIVVEQ